MAARLPTGVQDSYCVGKTLPRYYTYLRIPFPDSCYMPNLYFCQRISRGLGILRAVLSSEEGRNFLNHTSAHYVGQQFPTMNQGLAADFAVLRIFEEEADEEWRAGFYCFDADIMRIEKELEACTTKLPEKNAKQPKRPILKLSS